MTPKLDNYKMRYRWLLLFAVIAVIFIPITNFIVLFNETNRYNALKDSVESRLGLNDDCMMFVTLDNPFVTYRTKAILGQSYDGELSVNEIQLIFNWIIENIEFNYDTFIGKYSDCYFYPHETLEFGYGDCEDQAILMLSMCLAEEDVSWIYCADVSYYDSNKERNVSHVFVISYVDDEIYIFDLTHKWHSNTSKSGLEAIKEFEDYWNYNNLKIERIFNKEAYYTFNDNQEFFDYF